jgi:glycine/D-amino acid oxidase-like deaminating enzyme
MHDYIIVGKGIAGSILSYRLCEAGKSLAIIDEDSPLASWKVAGGVWNAITFKKILKGWKADEMIHEAGAFYTDLQEKMGLSFFENKEIVKVFPDFHFQNTWYSKSGNAYFADYLEDKIPEEIKDLPLSLPFGAGTVKNGGYVNLPVFINALKDYFKDKATILNERIDYDLLQVGEEFVDYKGHRAKGIIFCEGFEVVNNPYFNWLPLKLTKGETLILKNPGWHFSSIINNGKHLIDHHDGTMGVGATFEWKELNHEVSVKGRDELLGHLEKNFDYRDWEVLEQKAGIRPTVSDRHPLAGVHPKLHNVFIFNGLGAKGVLTAPWLSTKMLEFLMDGAALPEEGNIKRFIKKHFR